MWWSIGNGLVSGDMGSRNSGGEFRALGTGEWQWKGDTGETEIGQRQHQQNFMVG